ncbi:hypothetical protein V2J09_021077 [Rumex salicifolius]
MFWNRRASRKQRLPVEVRRSEISQASGSDEESEKRKAREIRHCNEIVGFEVVTVGGQSAPLASINTSRTKMERTYYRVQLREKNSHSQYDRCNKYLKIDNHEQGSRCTHLNPWCLQQGW